MSWLKPRRPRKKLSGRDTRRLEQNFRRVTPDDIVRIIEATHAPFRLSGEAREFFLAINENAELVASRRKR